MKYGTSLNVSIVANSKILELDHAPLVELSHVTIGKTAKIMDTRPLVGKDVSLTFTTQEDGVPSAFL